MIPLIICAVTYVTTIVKIIIEIGTFIYEKCTYNEYEINEVNTRFVSCKRSMADIKESNIFKVETPKISNKVNVEVRKLW